MFTPSSKSIPEEDSKQQVSSNASQMNSYLAAGAGGNKSSEPQQPTMSAILAGNIKRSQPQQQSQSQQQNHQQPQQQTQQQPTSQSVRSGQALLQQIQQSRNLTQMNSLSQFSKQATESIKSLVGLNPSSMLSNDIISAGSGVNDTSLNTSNLAASQASKPSQQTQPTTAPVSQNRMKVQPTRSSKIPDAAVEMHTDQMANLSVRFGSLEFGGGSSFSIGASDSILFESVTGPKKPEPTGNKSNLSFTSAVDASSATNSSYRQPTQQQSAQQQQQTSSSVAAGKSNMMQSNVISQRLNESLIGGAGSSEHRNDNNASAGNAANKALGYNAGNKPQQQQQQQQDSRDKYLNYKAYQPNQDNSQGYSTYNQTQNSYYSNSAQIPLFGNSNVSQSLIGANTGAANAYSSNVNSAGTTYGVSSSQSNANNNINKLRGDIDAGNNTVQPQQHQQAQQVSGNQQSGTKSAYDTSNVSSAGNLLLSNSILTTNPNKETVSASMCALIRIFTLFLFVYLHSFACFCD